MPSVYTWYQVRVRVSATNSLHLSILATGTFIQMEMSSILRVVKVSLRYILRATDWEAMDGRVVKLLLLAPRYRP